MITKIRIIYMVIVVLVMMPRISTAYSGTCIYGVTINLTNNEKLNGYIETDWLLKSCKENKDTFENKYEHATWESFLERMRKPPIRAVEKDQLPSNLQKNDPAESQPRKTGERTIRFIGKLIEIKYNQVFDNKIYNISRFFAVRSSVKKIKIDDIRNIEGVCKKWDGSDTVTGIELITDYMAEYISNHKLIASYTFDADSSVEEYAYSQHTTYLSYNPEYPRKRLIKQRKIINKMSDDILDKNNLIRFTWADD